MVLQEVEHAVGDAFEGLPATCEPGGGIAVTLDADDGVVESDFVVKIVETSVLQVRAVLADVVDFADEDCLSVLLADGVKGPVPELEGYHVDHVAAEAVDAPGKPVAQDMNHLLPQLGNGIEVGLSGLVVAAVVELYGLVPVVGGGEGGEAVVAGDLGWELDICRRRGDVYLRGELLVGDVVVVVGRGEAHRSVVGGAEWLHACRCLVGAVLAGGVVGNEVDEYFHSGLVGPLHERVELLEASGDVHGKRRIDVIVVLDGVRRSGLSLDHMLVVGLDAEDGKVGHRGHLQDSGVPNGIDSQLCDFAKDFGGEVGELAGAVLP